MSYNAIFWDWNGTILDDCAFNLSCMNAMLKRRGMEEASIEKYRKSFGFPVIDFYRKMGIDFEKDNYEEMAAEYVQLYKNGKDIPLRKGIKEALAVYRDKKIPQYILSASEKNILLQELEKQEIGKYFNDVIAMDNIYAEGKKELAKRYITEHGIGGKIVLIGDTKHDCETASFLGWDCILVAGGHNDRDDLIKTGVPVVDAPNETYRYILQTGRGEREKRFFDYSFVSNYKAFYDDLKNTSKTEDW